MSWNLVKPIGSLSPLLPNKGELYTFGQLSFEGNTVICDEDIDRLFEVRRGDPFSLEGIRETIDAHYRCLWTSLVILTLLSILILNLVEGEYRYNVNFKIEEGEQYRVGLIRVFGNIYNKNPCHSS